MHRVTGGGLKLNVGGVIGAIIAPLIWYFIKPETPSIDDSSSFNLARSISEILEYLLTSLTIPLFAGAIVGHFAWRIFMGKKKE